VSFVTGSGAVKPIPNPLCDFSGAMRCEYTSENKVEVGGFAHRHL